MRKSSTDESIAKLQKTIKDNPEVRQYESELSVFTSVVNAHMSLGIIFRQKGQFLESLR